MRPRIPLLLALLLASSARVELGECAGDVAGSFRLLKASVVVGEPIVVEFTVTNGRNASFAFSEGGDYRGTQRHARYSFRVVDAAGRDFTRAPEGDEGGKGREIQLAPGQTFRSWQLLNGWVHLLPVGTYRVHCERKLGPDGGPAAAKTEAAPTPVLVAQDHTLEVSPYAKEAIVASVAALHVVDASAREGVETFFGVPVEWAVADLNAKLEAGGVYVGKDAEFETAVLDTLPTVWDDRLFVEYGFRANRNWVTPGTSEPFELTFTARNNGRTPLPHRFDESALVVNGTVLPRWSTGVRDLLRERKKAATLAPGAVVELVVSCDDLVPPRGTASIEWTLGRVKRSIELRVGR